MTSKLNSYMKEPRASIIPRFIKIYKITNTREEKYISQYYTKTDEMRLFRDDSVMKRKKGPTPDCLYLEVIFML